MISVAMGATFSFKDQFKGFDCCTSHLSALCPQCYGMSPSPTSLINTNQQPGCPLKSQHTDNIQTMLQSRIFGQDHVIEMLYKAFKARSSTQPLTIHMAGGIIIE